VKSNLRLSRFFLSSRREEKKMIGLSIELRRRKSFIGRIKKKIQREKKEENVSYFFSLSLSLSL
jgi:hypothetical protein